MEKNIGLDILFLGRLFPREKETEIKTKVKNGMQDAANALQWNIIDGLEENNCGRIKILNYLPVDSYPRGYADTRIEEFSFCHTEKYLAEDLNVGCTNRSVIKHIVNIFPFKRELKKWVKSNNGSSKVLIMYSASVMFLGLAKYAKKLNKNIKICCIIADIPEFASAGDLRGVRKVYNIYQTTKSSALLKYVDKFVLLTEQMAQRLKISSPFIVVEGIASAQTPSESSASHMENDFGTYILYSGSLNYKFGIGGLLDAFSLISKENVKLVICGWGQAEERIRNEMTRDPRVVFLGKVDRTEALKLQRAATVLVNPRQNNEEFTKYSFPSKTMEYLASGVPLVAYRLDGIPCEYDEYIQYIGDDSPQSMADELSRVLQMSDAERIAKGEKAKRFVLENKNYIIQTKRILDFLYEC